MPETLVLEARTQVSFIHSSPPTTQVLKTYCLLPGTQLYFQFDGMIYHASQHTDATQYNPAGKMVVVRTRNSGHDISQDFCEHGAEVTWCNDAELMF